MRANALAWNPREPLNFSVAGEDTNVYTFDMRKLERALMVCAAQCQCIETSCYWRVHTIYKSPCEYTKRLCVNRRSIIHATTVLLACVLPSLYV